MRNRFNYYTSDRTPYDIAAYRVAKIRKFFIHLILFSIVFAIYILKIYFGFRFNFEPFSFVSSTLLAIWGLVIVIKAVKLFSREIFFGKDWEQRKMDEFMGKEKTTKWE